MRAQCSEYSAVKCSVLKCSVVKCGEVVEFHCSGCSAVEKWGCSEVDVV